MYALFIYLFYFIERGERDYKGLWFILATKSFFFFTDNLILTLSNFDVTDKQWRTQ